MFLSLSHSQTHAHRRCWSNTLLSVSLSPLTHVQRTTQKMLSVFGCSVIAGAEKAMCLQWQVHSGVSSVPTTRLQNNITLFSSAYAHTHLHTVTHTRRTLFADTQNQPHKSTAEVPTLWLSLNMFPFGQCWHSAIVPVSDTMMQVNSVSLNGSTCVVWPGLTTPDMVWRLNGCGKQKRGIQFNLIKLEL